MLKEFLTEIPDLNAGIEHIIAENNLVTVSIIWSWDPKEGFTDYSTNKHIKIRCTNLYIIDNEIIEE